MLMKNILKPDHTGLWLLSQFLGVVTGIHKKNLVRGISYTLTGVDKELTIHMSFYVGFPTMLWKKLRYVLMLWVEAESVKKLSTCPLGFMVWTLYVAPEFRCAGQSQRRDICNDPGISGFYLVE